MLGILPAVGARGGGRQGGGHDSVRRGPVRGCASGSRWFPRWSSTLLGFVLTLYLLIEAQRTREWLVAFVPKAYRGRVEQTLNECERIIFAYVAGNVTDVDHRDGDDLRVRCRARCAGGAAARDDRRAVSTSCR